MGFVQRQGQARRPIGFARRRRQQEGLAAQVHGHVAGPPGLAFQIEVLVGLEAQQRHRLVLAADAVQTEGQRKGGGGKGELARRDGTEPDIRTQRARVTGGHAQVTMAVLVEHDDIGQEGRILQNISANAGGPPLGAAAGQADARTYTSVRIDSAPSAPGRP